MEHENPEAGMGVDLFGNPIKPLRDFRGRPSYKKSKENQDFVAVRVAAGWSQAMIAEALGCDEKTLRKHFSRELSSGQIFVEGLCLDVLMQKAREGHTPSVHRLLQRLERVAVPLSTNKGKAKESAETEKVEGKKEAALKQAQRPGDGYADLYERLKH